MMDAEGRLDPMRQRRGLRETAMADALDAYIRAHLGSLVYRPVDLLTKPDGSLYPDLDSAAKAGNWPSRSALQGKAIIEPQRRAAFGSQAVV